MNLAEKMRPSDFDEVIGNKHIVNALKNQLLTNSLSQTIMFTGEAGSGKTSFAKIIAKSLSAEVIELDCGSDGNIDNIREIIESVYLSSLFSKNKVFILDEAHSLSKPAQSALLKTLEDPQDGVYFILLTTDPQKVINTIRTRCVEYTTLPANTEEIGQAVRRIESEYNISFENREDLWSIVEQANGSLRQVYAFLEKLIASADNRGVISSEAFNSLLGKRMDMVDENLPKAFLSKDLNKALFIIDSLKKEGGSPTGTLLGVYNYLKVVYTKQDHLITSDQKKLMSHISNFLIAKEITWTTLEHIIWENL